VNKEKNEEWFRKVLEKDKELTDRQIVEDMAVSDWVNPNQPTRKIILDLISWNSFVALDPSVSKAAADLYHEGYLAGKTGAVNRLNEANLGDDEVSF